MTRIEELKSKPFFRLTVAEKKELIALSDAPTPAGRFTKTDAEAALERVIAAR